MPTASRSPVKTHPTNAARWVLISANLPLALFTAYAIWIAAGGPRPGSGCFARPILGWCPGCGLTGDYARILTLNPPEGWYIWVILSAFVLNAAWSIQKAKRIARRRSAIDSSVGDPA
jgi:hypothetical protein